MRTRGSGHSPNTHAPRVTIGALRSTISQLSADAAKERQTFLQARIAQLQRRMVALSMINLDKVPKDKVGLGSTVTLKQTDTGESITFEIVTPEEADPTVGRISPSSPIGRSLLNHEEGDTLEVKVPSGSKEYEITRLVTIHDAPEPAPQDQLRGEAD